MIGTNIEQEFNAAAKAAEKKMRVRGALDDLLRKVKEDLGDDVDVEYVKKIMRKWKFTSFDQFLLAAKKAGVVLP